MTPHPPSGAERTFEIDVAYTRDEIHERVGGSKRACLPTRDGIVVAACLLASLNPAAPRAVLCGAGPRNGAMGTTLAHQGAAFPLFLKAGVGRWIYRGHFVASASATSGPTFERYIAGSGRQRSDVSRVVLLDPA